MGGDDQRGLQQDVLRVLSGRARRRLVPVVGGVDAGREMQLARGRIPAVSEKPLEALDDALLRQLSHEAEGAGAVPVEDGSGGEELPQPRLAHLPVEVDRDRVNASYTDGVLTIEAPKSEAALPRTVEINVN